MTEFINARGMLPLHDFERFHRESLPRLVERHGHLAADDVAGLAPIAFSTGGGHGFTYRPAGAGAGVSIAEGCDEATTVVELDGADFSDFANEIHTVSGLALGQKMQVVRGGLEELQRWEPALRALYHGRPIWTAAKAASLVDAEGRPLDLERKFSVEDSDEEIRAFLEIAGFVHIRSVFGPDDIAAYGAEVDRVRAALEPGQGDAWWSTTHAGEQVVTRINYLDRWSDLIKAACFDDRVQRFGRLLGPEYRVCDDRLDGPMAFVKNSDVAHGLGDLNWHQDDGLGGHPVMCPLMQIGIQLDHANPENGQLHVLAGSHRYTNHPMAWGDEDGQPVVRFVTEPGDVTVHYGDIYHTTPPPTGPDAGRRVLYFKFAKPRTFDAIPAGAHYNDLLFKPGSGGRVAVRSETWSEDDTQAEFEAASFDGNKPEK